MAAARPLRSKLLRFAAVGIANSGVDLAVFTAAITLGAAPLLANFLGWAVAVVFSYVLNSRWSFERDRSVGDARSALRFITLGALVTLGVSSVVIVSLAEAVGPFTAKLVGLALAAVLNFVAARWAIENRIS